MDKNNQKLFSKELIFLDKKFNTQIEFFAFISDELYQKKYVKESFFQGLVEREAQYPTGLPSFPFPVAIPHCNPEHVIKNSISIVRFEKPVMFYEMGKIDALLAVDFAFVLTLDGKLQSPILKELMKIFMDKEVMKKLKDATADQILSLIREE